MTDESSQGLLLKYPDLGGLSLSDIRDMCHPVLQRAVDEAIESVGGPTEAVAGFNSAI